MADSNPKSSAGQEAEKTCWQCGRVFTTAMEVCPDDGARLIETDLEDKDDPLIGSVFDGRFQIKNKLGEGGMGTVYSARRLDFETDVALKLLKMDYASDDGIRKRFMYEARVISNLKHPHAVRLFDFGQTSDGHVYMVMELLSGESLADRLSYRFVTYREVFDIIPPICGVLGEAHIREVIHRDLKPENIFLLEVDGNEEFPKLLDFGIAKHKREETMTKSGTLWGTPAYMSPEQAGGDVVGGPADIYGIGIMIFELISGNLPFHASTQMGYAVRHINEQVRPLSSVPGLDSVPPALDELVMQMLAKLPQDRPDSMEVVAESLNRIREDCFDDALLDSVPAEEVDPIGLQRWINEAPDVTGELESPTKNLTVSREPEGDSPDAANTASAKVSVSTPPRGSKASKGSDLELMETVAVSQSEARRPTQGVTESLDEPDESAITDEQRPWGPLSVVTQNPPSALLIAGGGVLVAIVLASLLVVGDDTAATDDEEREELPVVTADLPTQQGEAVGTSSVPADAGTVVAVGASRAMVVVLQAHGVVQGVQADELDEDLERDFDFLHEVPVEEAENIDSVEESDELREALERTF